MTQRQCNFCHPEPRLERSQPRVFGTEQRRLLLLLLEVEPPPLAQDARLRVRLALRLQVRVQRLGVTPALNL